MNKFKWHKFDELYKLSSGISSKPSQAGHGSPFVSFSTVFNYYFLPDKLIDLMNTSKKEQELYSIKEGDILLTRTSEVIDELGMSSVALKDYPEATYSGFVKRLRPKQNDLTYHKYLGFYLRSELFRKTMTNNAIMTLRASFNEEIFSYINLYLPDYETQKDIGDFLFVLYSKIELNKLIIVELDSMIKNIYDYWFVQFDFPDTNRKPYKYSGGKMVWSEELKREIPEGWIIGRLGNFTDVFDSKRIPLSKIDRSKIQGVYPYYGATEVMDYIDKYIFDGEYILLAEDGSVMDSKGFPNLQYAYGKFWVNNHAHVLHAKDKSSNEFLFRMLKYLPVVKMMTGSVQMKINQENLMNTQILIPEKEILSNFSRCVDPLRKKMLSLDLENKKLTEFRNWLSPMLMNGQVRLEHKKHQINNKTITLQIGNEKISKKAGSTTTYTD
jgi:type I restriction enzyme S subunit